MHMFSSVFTKKENFQAGPHDQAVFLYTPIYGIFRVEGFIEFFYKPEINKNPYLPEYFLEATLFTYSIEHYGRCGLVTGFNSTLKAHDVWDYCSILRRYQGRTDFILEDYLFAYKKLEASNIKNLRSNDKIRKRRKRRVNNDLHQDDESIAFPPIKWKTERKGKQRLLFVKGQDDKTTVANVTIAIKVMKSYYRSMPVFSAYGMPLISAYLIQVRVLLTH